MIEGGELLQFVIDTFKRKDEKSAWELYLSRVYGQSFNDFYESIKAPDEAQRSTMTTEEIINDSLMISGAFKEVSSE